MVNFYLLYSFISFFLSRLSVPVLVMNLFARAFVLLILLIYTKESLDDTDLSITPTNNTPVSPPIEIPVRTVSPLNAQVQNTIRLYNFVSLSDKPNLSPISGSFDLDSPSDSPLTFGKPSVNSGSGDKSRPQSATNELPLTQINLALFTSELENRQGGKASSTNELPLSHIKFKSKSCRVIKQDTLDSQNDDASLEVNFDNDIKEKNNKSEKQPTLHQRSFSDPNILDNEWIDGSANHFLLEKYSESLSRESDPNTLSPDVPSQLSRSFYPGHDADTTCLLCTPRHPSNLLSFFSSRRSLSHPANPRVIDPCVSYSECGQAIKRHRHSIAGQMSYFKVMGLSYGMPGFKKLIGGSTNSLFSTAVISGSSSAPNLRDMISSTASASAIEGFGGVPPIRPLETLHNALSLKQIDAFLDRMTTAQLYRTPSSTPPKYPSTPLPTPTGSNVTDYGHMPGKSEVMKLQSPSNSVGWSGPPSFISSSGPSSPGMSDTNSKESSEMSSSIISADGLNLDEFAKIFPTAPGLDNDLGRVGMTLDTLDKEISGSIEFSEYYANLHRPQAGSGEITPISCGSEAEFPTNDATAGSSSAPEFDFTITEDIDKDDIEIIDNNETVTSATSKMCINNSIRSSLLENNINSGSSSSKVISPSTANIQIYNNDLTSGGNYSRKSISNIKRAQSLYSRKSDVNTIDIKDLVKNVSKFQKDVSSSNPNVNVANVAYLKWNTNKEHFFDISKDYKIDNIDFGKNLNTGASKKFEKYSDFMAKLGPGAILVKEGYIEPAKISRVSKSFHGKSPIINSYLDISNVHRKASDIPSTSTSLNESAVSLRPEDEFSKNELMSKNRPQFITQMSQPCGESSRSSGYFPRKSSLTTEMVARNARFTTTRVDEAEHAASVGMVNRSSRSTNNEQLTENITKKRKNTSESPG